MQPDSHLALIIYPTQDDDKRARGEFLWSEEHECLCWQGKAVSLEDCDAVLPRLQKQRMSGAPSHMVLIVYPGVGRLDYANRGEFYWSEKYQCHCFHGAPQTMEEVAKIFPGLQRQNHARGQDLGLQLRFVPCETRDMLIVRHVVDVVARKVRSANANLLKARVKQDLIRKEKLAAAPV